MLFMSMDHRLRAALLCVTWLWVMPAQARENPRQDGAKTPPHATTKSAERAAPERLYRDFPFPDPDRPWAAPRYLNPGARRSHYVRSRYGRYPRYYDDDYTYRFGASREDDPYEDQLRQAYRQGITDGRDFERFEIQADRGVDSYLQAMSSGHAAFASRRYGVAARNFLLAATLNQADPSARLCAAHAQVALGEFEAAARLLRRALELQPRLVYLPLDIREAYGRRADFAQHVGALQGAAEHAETNAGLWLLVGYYRYFSGSGAEAKVALGKAAGLSRHDRQVRSFYDVVRMTASPPTARPPRIESSTEPRTEPRTDPKKPRGVGT